MVAGGKNVAAHIKKLIGDGRCEPKTAGRVFGVGNHQIDLVRLHHVTQLVAHGLWSWAAEGIAYKENLHEYSILTSGRALTWERCESFHEGDAILCAEIGGISCGCDIRLCFHC